MLDKWRSLQLFVRAVAFTETFITVTDTTIITNSLPATAIVEGKPNCNPKGARLGNS
jgi:hypothetical protein